MRQLFRAVFAALVLMIMGMGNLWAYSYENHTGSYIYGMGGFVSARHDTNVRTGTKFGNSVEPGFGITYGDNIADWIAAELQIAYGTATGTTPSGTGREHLLTIRLNAKYSFLTKSAFNSNRTWKVYPYVKAGGVGNGLFVNAPSTDDKVGAFGGGFGIGGGLEANYKYLYLGVDVSNDFIFLKAVNKTIAGVLTKITAGGFSYQPSVMGVVGVHF